MRERAQEYGQAVRQRTLYNNYSETRNLIGQYIAVQDQAILHEELKCLPGIFSGFSKCHYFTVVIL